MPWQDYAGVQHSDPQDTGSSIQRLFGNLMAIQERKRQNAIQDEVMRIKQQEFQREQEAKDVEKQKNLLELAQSLAALKSGTAEPAKKIETPEISAPTGAEVAPHVTAAEMPLSERTDLDTEGIPVNPAGTPESIPLAPKQTLTQPEVPAERQSFRLRIPGLEPADVMLKNKEEVEADRMKKLEEAGVMAGHLVKLPDGSVIPASLATAMERNEGRVVKPEKVIQVPDDPRIPAAYRGKTFKEGDPLYQFAQHFSSAAASQMADLAFPKPKQEEGPYVPSQSIILRPGQAGFNVAQDMAYGSLNAQRFRTMVAYQRDPRARNAIYDTAKALNPNFNPAEFDLGYVVAANPKIRQQVAAQDNALGMAEHLIDVSDKAARSGSALLNKYVVIPGGIQIGNQKYSNLQAAQVAYADELSGALGFGSATDMNREMGFDMTRVDLSPAAFKDAMENIVLPFVVQKRKALVNQMGVYGKSIDKMSAGGGEPKGGQPTTTSGTTKGTYKDGDTKVINGHTYVRKGGQWELQ